MGRAQSSANTISRELLRLLPPDGSPIPNRAALALLSKRLGAAISNDDYFAARDTLLTDKLVGRVRGQGGSVYLIGDAQPPIRKDGADEGGDNGPPERELMGPLYTALKTGFRDSLDLPDDSPDPIIEDISTKGPKRGIWARPDFVFVSVSRFSILPGAHVDTHVFELKNEAGGGMKAVHEALAQARFANYAHLVWYVPDGSVREPELAEVVTHCGLHGVGCLRLRTEPRPVLEMLQDARRTHTTALEVDGFLESRLSSESKRRIADAVSRSFAR
ncbi:MAG: hypothetical protein SGI91_08435 [Alphaproteobacteria bacterium]|nr:hypothetical protein [Alphaproteobacteria bacterium]